MNNGQMNTFTRLMIVEAIDEENARNIRNILDAHAAGLADDGASLGFVAARRLSEDGGNMIVFETDWTSRDWCIRYHGTRQYRNLVRDIEQMTIGGPVLKFFRAYSHVEITA